MWPGGALRTAITATVGDKKIAAPALGEERDGRCDINSTHVRKCVHFSSAHARLCRAEEGPGVLALRQINGRMNSTFRNTLCDRRWRGGKGGRRRGGVRNKEGGEGGGGGEGNVDGAGGDAGGDAGRRLYLCFEAGDVMKMGFLYLSGGSWFSATPCDPPPFTVLHQELVRVLHHRSNGTMAFLF